MSNVLSMAAFALAASISPGPVNVVTLGASARHGLGRGLRVATGATLGFTALLVLTGLGLNAVLARVPQIIDIVQWAVVAFLVYMAYRLLRDNGELGATGTRGPSMLLGAAMQWVNPKAWLAAVAGMGAFAAGGEPALVWQFAAIYTVVCYVSMGSWAVAGATMRGVLENPRHMRWLNTVLALLLLVSAWWIVAG